MLNLLNRILDRLEEWIISALIAGATAITFVAVLHRYGASNSVLLADWAKGRGLTAVSDAANWVNLSLAAISLSWAQEPATYVFVWTEKFLLALSDAANGVYLWLAGVDLSWAQELATYMFVWMAKFGAALGVRTGIHVGVDVFVKRLPPEAAKPVILFALFCGALFTGVIGTLGAVYVYDLDPDEVSPELEWPSWIIYLCIPLGSYLMAFRFLQVAWRYYWSGHVPHQGHGIEYQGQPDLPVPLAEPAQ